MYQLKCLLAAVVAGLLLYAATAVTQVARQISQAEIAVEMLRDTDQTLTRQIGELQLDIHEEGFHRSAERIARDKLGLVKPGERIFYSVAN